MLDRISIHPHICHGKPCVRGTRIMVSQVLDLLTAGVSPTEIVSEDYFSDITFEDIRACVAFANRLVKNEDIHLYAPDGTVR